MLSCSVSAGTSSLSDSEFASGASAGVSAGFSSGISASFSSSVSSTTTSSVCSSTGTSSLTLSTCTPSSSVSVPSASAVVGSVARTSAPQRSNDIHFRLFTASAPPFLLHHQHGLYVCAVHGAAVFQRSGGDAQGCGVFSGGQAFG